MSKSKVIVKINGAEYTLMGDESEDYLFSIANYVDKKVKETLAGNSRHSTTSCAVLTAITLADELFKTRRQMDALKISAGEPEEKLRMLKEEYEKLQAEYISLNNGYEQVVQSHMEKETDIDTLKGEYNSLYEDYMRKNEEYERMLRENTYLKEQNKEIEDKLDEAKETVTNLKDQLLESQIELVRVKKDYKDLKDIQTRKKTV